MKKPLALATIMLITSNILAWRSDKESPKNWDRGQDHPWKMRIEPGIIKAKKLHRILVRWIDSGKEGEKYTMSSDLKNAVEKLTTEKSKIEKDIKNLYEKKMEAIKEFIKVTEKDISPALKKAQKGLRNRMMRPRHRRGPGIFKRFWYWLTGNSPRRPGMYITEKNV